jgi:hypothetical protein
MELSPKLISCLALMVFNDIRIPQDTETIEEESAKTTHMSD